MTNGLCRRVGIVGAGLLAVLVAGLQLAGGGAESVAASSSERGGGAAGVAAAAPPSLPDGLNVAIGARAWSDAGSSADSSIKAAVDGDATTRWCPGTGGVTKLQVTLPESVISNGIGVTFANKRPNDNARYTVDYGPNRHRLDPYPDQGADNWNAVEQGPLYLHGQVRARTFELTFRTDRITTPCVSEFRVFADSPKSDDLALGADLSTLKEGQVRGWKYYSDGVERPALDILREGGMNYARIRLWVNPSGDPNVVPNLTNVLEMARQVKAKGMKVLLCLHMSDTWADPDHQTTPAAWQGQNLNQLTRTVRKYTRDVVRAFAEQGTPVDQVAVGNEVTQGFLWPTGELRVGDDGKVDWAPFLKLLQAGIEGAKAGNPRGHEQLIQIQIDPGGDNATSRQFYDAVERAGIDYDIIGLSYYVWAHGTLTSLNENMVDMARRYGKEVSVAEIQYPWERVGSFAGGAPVYPELTAGMAGYPMTPAGSASLLRDVVSLNANLPDDAGHGVYWWNAFDRGGRVVFGMFDRTGNALDIVDAYRVESD